VQVSKGLDRSNTKSNSGRTSAGEGGQADGVSEKYMFKWDETRGKKRCLVVVGVKREKNLIHKSGGFGVEKRKVQHCVEERGVRPGG